MAEVNEEALLERRKALQQQLEQANNTLNALFGATQEVDFWLEQLKEEPSTEAKD